jgi:hypothetical protein
MLSVEVTLTRPPPISLLDVPSVDVSNLNYATVSEWFIHSDRPEIYYDGPSPEVKRIAAAVAAQGAILPIRAPGLNVSWETTFAAPSLSCGYLNPEQQKTILRSLICASAVGATPMTYGFASWTGVPNPFDKKYFLTTSGASVNTDEIADELIDDVTGIYSNTTSLYVTALPAFSGIFVPEVLERMCKAPEPLPTNLILGDGKPTLIKCDCFNSTYHVEFNYRNGEQRTVANVTRHEALDKIYPSNSRIASALQKCASDDHGCLIDATRHLAPSLVYHALNDAFGLQVKGWIATDSADYPNVRGNLPETILLQTPELQNAMSLASSRDYQSWTQRHIGHIHMGYNSLENRTQPLIDALEEMFQNMTISMMNSNYLK